MVLIIVTVVVLVSTMMSSIMGIMLRVTVSVVVLVSMGGALLVKVGGWFPDFWLHFEHLDANVQKKL